jgi:mannose/fructose/sorbose-specific phosphotransferase system IIA component
MIALILCSHGNFAAGLKEAAGMIYGEPEACEVISLWDANGLEGLAAEIKQKYDAFHTKGYDVVCLCDLPSATPYNACCLALSETDARMIAGMNLPLLINIVSQRDDVTSEGLDAFLAECVADSKDAMQFAVIQDLMAQDADDDF